MPKITKKEATGAFAKYKAEYIGDTATTLELFISWVEADEGAYARYVHGERIRPNQNIEDFKHSAATTKRLMAGRTGASGSVILTQKGVSASATNIVVEEAAASIQNLIQDKSNSLDLMCQNIVDDNVLALTVFLLDHAVKIVNLRGNKIGLKGATELAKILPKSQITRLDLRDNKIPDKGAAELAKAFFQSKMTRINLWGYGAGDDEAGTLEKNGLPKSKFNSLNLDSYTIGRGAILLGQTLQHRYTVLELRGESLDMLGKKIGEDEAIVLAYALIQSEIKSLDLGNNNIGDVGVTEFAKVLPQTQITNIDLSGCNIKVQGAIELANALPQSKIRSLNLRGNDIESAGAAALVQALPQSQLSCLNLWVKGDKWGETFVLAVDLSESKSKSKGFDLDSEKIGRGVTALTKTVLHSKAKDLDLRGLNINDQEAIVIAYVLTKVLPKSQITHINLSKNNIGVEGAIALAQALLQTKITSLDLLDNKIGDDGAAAFAQALPRSQITHLDLSENNIGDDGLIELVKTLPQSKIESFSLKHNKIQRAATILAQALSQTKITNLDLLDNNIGDEGATALAKVLLDSQIINLGLSKNNIGVEGAIAFAQTLPQSQITDFNFSDNNIGDGGAIAFAKILVQSKIMNIDLSRNNIGVVGAAALAQPLTKSKVKNIYLNGNKIWDGRVAASAQTLPQTQFNGFYFSEYDIGDDEDEASASLAHLPYLGDSLKVNQIDSTAAALAKCVQGQSTFKLIDGRMTSVGAAALAKVLIMPGNKITSLDLSKNHLFGDSGVAKLAIALPKSQITRLNLKSTNIGDAGAAELAAVLVSPDNKITSLDLSENLIGYKGCGALLIAVKSSCIVTKIFGLKLDEKETSILNEHLMINKLLTASTLSTFKDLCIQELETAALMHIGHPSLLDDLTFEKPKKLLLRSVGLGSIQAIYILANLYINELKDLTTAKRYYADAASKNHEISKLCLQRIEHIERKEASDNLKLGELTIPMPRRFSINTTKQKLTSRNEEIIRSGEPNILVSKTGISLTALNELLVMEAMMDVFVAPHDYEPQEEGHLHFNHGQTIYINCFENIKKINEGQNFIVFVKDVLAKSLIPYNRDKQGEKQADVGFIPYDTYLSLHQKPRADWTAEEVCNAIIVPKTKPKGSEKSKSYVDTLPQNQRGKPFEGYIFSYARATKFTDILQALNERFKDRNPDEVFIWIDSICVNQHAWMEMDSNEISKILEISLMQQFTHISEGRLINFDGARPTNLTRAWCLLELSTCLKVQENTVAQTEICMTSNVQAEMLAQDLMQVLNALDSSKAQCFNPTDKIAIDAQIRKALGNVGEMEISMEEAYIRLNNQIKSWLVTKFLPDFSKVKEFEQEVSPIASVRNDVAAPHKTLTLAYDTSRAKESEQVKNINTNVKPKTKKAAKCTIM